jgi:hypothetical protein
MNGLVDAWRASEFVESLIAWWLKWSICCCDKLQIDWQVMNLRSWDSFLKIHWKLSTCLPIGLWRFLENTSCFQTFSFNCFTSTYKLAKPLQTPHQANSRFSTLLRFFQEISFMSLNQQLSHSAFAAINDFNRIGSIIISHQFPCIICRHWLHDRRGSWRLLWL